MFPHAPGVCPPSPADCHREDVRHGRYPATQHHWVPPLHRPRLQGSAAFPAEPEQGDLRRDYAAWKTLLREAGVREARLHDARHTAATTLLLLGTPERAVMDVMGWSQSSMVKRYAHVTARRRRDIADRLNAYLWESK